MIAANSSPASSNSSNSQTQVYEITPQTHPHLPFWDFESSPARLWVKSRDPNLGLLNRIPDYGLGIVGTRSPTRASIDQVIEVVGSLAKSRLVIISGFARGVDLAAHRSALRFGLPTIGFVAGGIHFTYPQHAPELSQEILQAGGSILSENTPYAAPQKFHFLKRNRLLAAASRATWIVQSAARSGALNTAQWTLEYGRDLYVSPAHPSQKAFAGNLRLLRSGAHTLFDSTDFQMTWHDLIPSDRKGKRVQDLDRGTPISHRVLRQAYFEAANHHRDVHLFYLQDAFFDLGGRAEDFYESLKCLIDQGEYRLQGPSVVACARVPNLGIRTS